MWRAKQQRPRLRIVHLLGNRPISLRLTIIGRYGETVRHDAIRVWMGLITSGDEHRHQPLARAGHPGDGGKGTAPYLLR
jgi:hypothetical protein